tara:strand:- start:30 stop:353 length:324 start_codon:yes stop_codon:yes gene_type:complete
MSWKEILKVSPRERMDAEDFAPKEMQQFRDEKHRDAQNSIKEELREHLKALESRSPLDEDDWRIKAHKKQMEDLTRPLEGFDHTWFRLQSQENLVNGLRAYFDEEEK